MSYFVPYEAVSNIIAETPEAAAEVVKIAVKADEAPPEMKFEIVSVELLEENISVDENELAEDYKALNNKVLN